MSERTALGLLDCIGLAPSVVAADAMLKAAPVRLAEIEYSGGLEITGKILGEPDAVEAALAAGRAAAGERYENGTLIPAFGQGVECCIHGELSYIGILDAYSKLQASGTPAGVGTRISLGMIETIGYLPLTAAVDEMLKCADVGLLRSERIGGMMASAFFHGLPSDLHRAVERGREIVRGYGDVLIGAYVIENPHGQLRGIFFGEG